MAKIPLAAVSNQNNRAASNSHGERRTRKFKSQFSTKRILEWERNQSSACSVLYQPLPSERTAKLNKNQSNKPGWWKVKALWPTVKASYKVKTFLLNKCPASIYFWFAHTKCVCIFHANAHAKEGLHSKNYLSPPSLHRPCWRAGFVLERSCPAPLGGFDENPFLAHDPKWYQK